ncbi:MAG: spore protease YyaC [Cellulosilyticaceae bacterium]
MYPVPYTETSPVYININDAKHFFNFCEVLCDYLTKHLPLFNNKLVIVCIGTDRATGDSLGPLIGYKLGKLNYESVSVYGTLDEPVHAKNLSEMIAHIEVTHPNALVIAIDACLGAMQNVGCISIGEGSIRPGAGVKKDLPSIGHLYITGIVNFNSLMNMAILQNTRLSLVMKMADTISSGIRYSLWQYYKKGIQPTTPISSAQI